MPAEEKLHTVVVVLGDLGRSPRMQYHVLSLLQAGHSVDFVGYTGESLIPALEQFGDQLKLVRFHAPKLYALKELFLPIYFMWRIISLTIGLTAALFLGTRGNPKLVLVQNPPAVPLLAVAAIYCWFWQAALVIDWHNLGFSMLPVDGLVRYWAKAYERAFAPAADGHLTVTKALRDFLLSDLNVDGANLGVLNDCPPHLFRLRTIKEQHHVLQTVHERLVAKCPPAWVADLPPTSTLFTEEIAKNRFAPRKGRPALVVSSTSWTKDEDIGLLIEACQQVDSKIQQANSDLKIVCAITGKGPLKSVYEQEIARLSLTSVMVTTLWIAPADYPAWLACADLGVSLHTSTSGLDLPIKILDYFGCEVPVCAYSFRCLRELVQDDVNGRTFTEAEQLSQLLYDLLQPLTDVERAGNHDFGALQRYSRQVQGRLLWSENWPKNAWPVLQQAVERRRRRRNRATVDAGDKQD